MTIAQSETMDRQTYIETICDNAMCIVGAAFEVEKADLIGARGAKHISDARHLAIYLAHTSAGLSFEEIATQFKRNRTTIHHSIEATEDMRDKREVDFLLDCFDGALHSWVQRA